MRIRMFKRPQHRQYDYVPRYFNPEEEERKERIRQAEARAEKGSEGMKARISSGLRRQANGQAYRTERQKILFRSNMMLFVILILLIFASLYAMEVYLPKLLEKWG